MTMSCAICSSEKVPRLPPIAAPGCLNLRSTPPPCPPPCSAPCPAPCSAPCPAAPLNADLASFREPCINPLALKPIFARLCVCFCSIARAYSSSTSLLILRRSSSLRPFFFVDFLLFLSPSLSLSRLRRSRFFAATSFDVVGLPVGPTPFPFAAGSSPFAAAAGAFFSLEAVSSPLSPSSPSSPSLLPLSLLLSLLPPTTSEGSGPEGLRRSLQYR